MTTPVEPNRELGLADEQHLQTASFSRSAAAKVVQLVEAPAIEKICNAAVKQGASDIHITAGKKPILRISGSLKPLETVVLTEQMCQQIFQSISDDNSKMRLQTDGQTDFAITIDIPNGDNRVFRVNAVKSLSVKSQDSIAMTMRLISNSTPDPEKIGFSKKFLEDLRHSKGLFLVTGATGSGKSTSLASILQWIANTSDVKIVTVEQPIEYRFQHGNSLIVQREVPNHARNFAETLRSMLRSDPDIIMVGELRDLDEIRVAMHAAESGHLVLSTVHTNSAAESVNRLVDVFPAEEQEMIRVMLSQCLLGVVSQDLIPRADGAGRVLAYELMLKTPAISNLIRQGQVQRIDSTLQTSAKDGMHTFDSYVMQLLKNGLISRENALNFSRNRQDMAKNIVRLQQDTSDN
jgi:twitching motility protein PilT